MNTGPLTGVSVVMPVLNEAKYLNQAVSEILNQQVSVPIEVVLAVGTSMDETALIAAELAAAGQGARAGGPLGRRLRRSDVADAG